MPFDSNEKSTAGSASKRIPKLYRIIFAFFILLQIFTQVSGADIEADLFVSGNDARAKVSVEFAEDSRIANRRSIGFVKSAIGAAGIDKRIVSIQFFTKDGTKIDARKLADGEWLADADVHRIEYELSLAPFRDLRAAAHISWIENSNGVLMLNDILPQFFVEGSGIRARVDLSLPNNTKVFGQGTKLGANVFEISDHTKAVFFVGQGLRTQTISLEGIDIEVILSGEWHFTDSEAGTFVREIALELKRVFGSFPGNSASIGIIRSPGQVAPGTWEAEARGKTVTIVSSDMHFRTQSIQRLHEQLRHELFHLWIPNGVRLSGDYAWFYEGFALYNSLKLAVRIKRIRFDDMLDTLSRAAAIEARQRPRLPLVLPPGQAADKTQIYARGMLMAFALDIDVIRSRKSTFDQLMRRFYSENIDSGLNGTAAAIELFPNADIPKDHVLGEKVLELQQIVKPAGLILVETNRQLAIKKRPNGSERAVLDELSYNSWRTSKRFETQ